MAPTDEAYGLVPGMGGSSSSHRRRGGAALMASVASARGAGGGIMTEKAVRQLRTNFERLGARLGENLAGAFFRGA